MSQFRPVPLIAADLVDALDTCNRDPMRVMLPAPVRDALKLLPEFVTAVSDEMTRLRAEVAQLRERTLH